MKVRRRTGLDGTGLDWSGRRGKQSHVLAAHLSALCCLHKTRAARIGDLSAPSSSRVGSVGKKKKKNKTTAC